MFNITYSLVENTIKICQLTNIPVVPNTIYLHTSKGSSMSDVRRALHDQ